MALQNDLTSDIDGILGQAWDIRDGEVVPNSETVTLAGGGVKLNATILYADLADSTELAMWDRKVTARVCKAFLACSTRIIRARGGEVRSFDGDRVMAIFVGNSKNTSAVKCGLNINWMFTKLLKPKFEAKFEALRNGTFTLAHCSGIDTSEVLSVRAGIRNNNDLIWVGQAPNVAAKLSGLRDSPFNTFISGGVHDNTHNEVKVQNGKNMWEERTWSSGPIQRVFRSSWTWAP